LSFREILLHRIHLQKKKCTNLSQPFSSAKTPSEQSGRSSLISVLEIRTPYGLSQNLCQNFLLRLYGIPNRKIPQNTCQPPRKMCPKFLTVRPSKTVQVRTDCTDLLSQKFVPSRFLDFCANKCSVAALECMPTLSKIATTVLNFCAH
jgi:hypothetical protein